VAVYPLLLSLSCCLTIKRGMQKQVVKQRIANSRVETVFLIVYRYFRIDQVRRLIGLSNIVEEVFFFLYLPKP
jgi:hypothetical protein